MHEAFALVDESDEPVKLKEAFNSLVKDTCKDIWAILVVNLDTIMNHYATEGAQRAYQERQEKGSNEELMTPKNGERPNG